MGTAAAAADRAGNALDALAIKLGSAALPLDKLKSETEEKIYGKLGKLADEHPRAAAVGGAIVGVGGHAVEAIGKAGTIGVGAWTLLQLGRLAKEKLSHGAEDLPKAPFANVSTPRVALDPNAANTMAMAEYQATVKALAENGGRAEGLVGAAAEHFARVHPNAQGRMIAAAKEAMKSAPGGASLMGKVAAGIGKGLVYAAVDYAATQAWDWGVEKAFGWTPKNLPKHEENIHKAADKFYRHHPALRFLRPGSFVNPAEGAPAAPKVDMGEVAAAATKAREAGDALKAGLDVSVQPKVDTSALDGAGEKAQSAGAALVSGLNVTMRPKVDLSAFDALDARIAKSMGTHKTAWLRRARSGPRVGTKFFAR